MIKIEKDGITVSAESADDLDLAVSALAMAVARLNLSEAGEPAIVNDCDCKKKKYKPPEGYLNSSIASAIDNVVRNVIDVGSLPKGTTVNDRLYSVLSEDEFRTFPEILARSELVKATAKRALHSKEIKPYLERSGHKPQGYKRIKGSPNVLPKRISNAAKIRKLISMHPDGLTSNEVVLGVITEIDTKSKDKPGIILSSLHNMKDAGVLRHDPATGKYKLLEGEP